MHPKKMLFSTQNITCEVAYIWLLSNRLRLNNDSAGSHIKEEGKLNMYTTRVWLLNWIRPLDYVSARFRRMTFRVLFIGFNIYFPSFLFIQISIISIQVLAYFFPSQICICSPVTFLKHQAKIPCFINYIKSKFFI